MSWFSAMCVHHQAGQAVASDSPFHAAEAVALDGPDPTFDSVPWPALFH